MASNQVSPVLIVSPPYTQQPSQQPQPGYPGQPQPSYPPQLNQPLPGSPQYAYPPPQPVQKVQQSTNVVNVGSPKPSQQPQPGYPGQPQPGYPVQHGPQPQLNQPLPGSPQYAYPPPQPVQQVQQSTTVVNVGSPATQTVVLPVRPRPQSYIALSICTCLLCVWPIGLAAIVFSSMVDSAYDGGDYDGALRNSNIAKWLNLASVLCGIVLIIIISTTS